MINNCILRYSSASACQCAKSHQSGKLLCYSLDTPDRCCTQLIVSSRSTAVALPVQRGGRGCEQIGTPLALHDHCTSRTGYVPAVASVLIARAPMRATLLRSSSRGRPKVDTRPEIGAPLRAYLKSEFARVLGAGARNQHAFGGTQDTGLSSSVEGFLPPVAGAAPREPRDGRKTEEGGVAGTTVHASEGGRAPTANSNHHSPAGGSGRLNASARAGSFGPDSPGDMSPSLTPTPGRARAHAKDRDFLVGCQLACCEPRQECSAYTHVLRCYRYVRRCAN